MSTNLPSTERDNAYLRAYMVEVMQVRFFGAFLSAAEHRKAADGLSRKALSDLLGKDEGFVSRLFSKPSNMTIKTMAEICFALNIELQFALVDNKDKGRVFLDVGMRCRQVHPAQQMEQYIDARRPSNEPSTLANFVQRVGRSKPAENSRWSIALNNTKETDSCLSVTFSRKKNEDR